MAISYTRLRGRRKTLKLQRLQISYVCRALLQAKRIHRYGGTNENESIRMPQRSDSARGFGKDSGVAITWDALNNSTVLITGATGLIGSQLVRAILAVNRIHSSQIRILAMVRSKDKASQIFGNLLQRPELEIITGDITCPICTDHEVDYIIHTASVTTSKQFITHPVDAIEVAVRGTKNVLELAKDKRCRSVVYLSSMEVYGTVASADNHRTTEDELGYIALSSVRSCYPEGKRLCENMCVCYAAQYGVPVKIARLSQTFGAGVSLNDNRVFAQFAKAAIAGKDIVLHTKGSSNGNYCYTAMPCWVADNPFEWRKRRSVQCG